MSDRILNDGQVADYQRDGYVRVKGFLDTEEVGLLRETAERDKVLHDKASQLKDASGLASKLTLWHTPGDDIYGMIARSEGLVGSVERLLGKEPYHWHSKMMLKEPKVGGAWEWHQDYGYWYHDGCLTPDLLSVMIAVTPATKENGCLQVLRGSHHMGRIEHHLSGTQAGADVERVENAMSRFPLEYAELDPGEALFFHSNLLHRSDQNRSDTARWSLICCYNAADNSPVIVRDHPSYTPLLRVPDSAIREAGSFVDDTAAGFQMLPVAGDDAR